MLGVAVQAVQLLEPIASHVATFKVYISAYRGYAPNDGWATQTVLANDAQDLLLHVINKDEKSQGVLVVGVSLGAAVALQVAALLPDQVSGLLLFAPWASLWWETLYYKPPWTFLLLPWLWTECHWDSAAAAASLPKNLPVAVLSPQSDEVIPSWQHRAVFESIQGSSKWWLPLDGVGHHGIHTMASVCSGLPGHHHADNCFYCSVLWELVVVVVNACKAAISFQSHPAFHAVTFEVCLAQFSAFMFRAPAQRSSDRIRNKPFGVTAPH
eukprot:3938023-Amphidinium_carterae.1